MARSSRIRKRFSPQLLSLEDRLTPTTFLVTSSADSGPGSLREAVGFANVLGGADHIDFKAGLGAIVLTTGQISISDAVTIQGPGAAALSVSGNNASRIFNTSPAGPVVPITISGLTLTGGSAATGNGGAVQVGDEFLTLTDCVISGNSVTGNNAGGGIGVVGGALTLIRCTLTGNQANANGGGIDASAGAQLTLIDCTVAGNSTKSYGGGLNLGTSSLSLRGSTISNNIASDGGGLSIVGAVAADVTNSTISGNAATGVGGGLALNSHDGSVAVDNCTVANNSANGSGGGLARVAGNGTLTLKSTIVAGNTSTGSASEDLFSTSSLTADHCAIGTSAGVSGFTGDAVTNALLGQDFKLGPLAFNGGRTKTHAPVADSPILNQGINASPALSVDQRGAPFVRSFGGVDIGAFEVQNLFVVTTTADSGSGSLRDAVAAANINPGADTISFDAGLFASPQTITLTTGEISISQAVTIAGPGLKQATISGNNASRIFTTVSAPMGAAMTFSGLTLTGGNDYIGGALKLGQQNTTISGCRITGNSATGFGGAVYLHGKNGSLTLDNCILSGNQATIHGGAILVSEGILTMSNCTVSGNVAVGANGGGVYFVNGTTLSIRNSTISGNTTGSGGGGIALGTHTGIAQIRNSTITLNSASFGGGISRNSGTGAIFVESSIVSGNTATTIPDLQTTGTVNATASILGSTSGIGKLNSDAATLELIGQAPLLGPLQDNGGPTFTHLPAVNSPAVNKGLNPAPEVPHDQRGPGYPRQRGSAIDIGAVEEMTLVVSNSSNAGPGSLRQALLDANAAAGTDTILFDSTAFATSKIIPLQTALPNITDGVSIIGTSATNVTVTRAAAAPGFPIFRVYQSNGAPVAFRGLTITGGYGEGSGGGIWIYGNETVSIAECTISGNSTGSSNLGGGVFAFQAASLTITDSTIADNTAAGGGGIFFWGPGLLVVENSTIANNTATLLGGGIYALTVTATLRNSTLTGNSVQANSGGGGLLVENSQATLQNCTVTANSATGNGGGIRAYSGTVTIDSTVVAGNTAGGAGDDVDGAITANYSLIGVANDGPSITGAYNKTGTLAAPLNPKLGPLQANGGPTLTHLPLPGSPLRNAGSNPAALATDQRGLPRSVGAPDIGAVEDQTPLPVVTGLSVNGGAGQRSRLTKIHLTFSAPVDAATLTATGAITLTRTAASGGGTVGTVVDAASGLIVAPASGMVTSITLTFANAVHPGVQYASLADGRWQLGIPSLNYQSPLNDPALRRLYGDGNADGTIDANDLASIGAAFGSTGVSLFDFNNDLTVDALDFGEFGARFGLTL